MNWYKVTKRIRGISYLYWQKTYREGRSVKTLNKYIGPHKGWIAVPAIAPTATTLPLPFPVILLPIASFNDKAYKLLTETPTKDVNWRHHWRGSAQLQTKSDCM